MASRSSPRLTSVAARKRRVRLVELVEALPESAAKECGGTHLSLEVRGKRFGYFLDDHHGDGRLALNCKAALGESHRLVAAHPDRFHLPAYLARHGWVGLWLDLPVIDWKEVREVLLAAYRLTAPARLLAKLAEPDSGKSQG